MTTLTITGQLGVVVKVEHTQDTEMGGLARVSVGADGLQCRFFALWRVLSLAGNLMPIIL